MHPKLTWVNGLASSLGLAMGTDVGVEVRDDQVDKLKKHVYLTFGEGLGKKDFNPIQTMIHAFAKLNDCVVYRTRKSEKQLVLEVLTKTRLGPVMNKDPFTRDKAR